MVRELAWTFDSRAIGLQKVSVNSFSLVWSRKPLFKRKIQHSKNGIYKLVYTKCLITSNIRLCRPTDITKTYQLTLFIMDSLEQNINFKAVVLGGSDTSDITDHVSIGWHNLGAKITLYYDQLIALNSCSPLLSHHPHWAKIITSLGLSSFSTPWVPLTYSFSIFLFLTLDSALNFS